MFRIRIRQLREEAGYRSQQAFANAFGVAQTTVAGWEGGKREPSYDTTARLADFFHVTVDYLLGRDSSLVPPAARKGIRIPVLGSVRAGIPVEAIEEVLDYEEITPELAAGGSFIALKVKGDSMAPGILDGDVVIVRQQEDAETGDTVVVLVNGDDATVKKIKKRPEGLMLIPANANYEPMFYTQAEVGSLPVRIVGKVVELRRPL